MCISYLPPYGVTHSVISVGTDPTPGTDLVMGAEVNADLGWAEMCETHITCCDKPIGYSKAEAKVVGWIMSCAPFTVDDREVKAMVEHVKIRRELQTTFEGNTLYAYLVASGERDVDIADIEKNFQHEWRLHPENQFNDDPCYLRQVAIDVQRSVEAFVVNLDQVCTSLIGMETGQTSNAAMEQMMKVRSCTAWELTQMIISKDYTVQSMVDKIKEIEVKHSESVVKAHKKELEHAFAGVSALAAIAAAVSDDRDFIDILQMHYAAARDVCAYPPRHMCDQLAMVGLSTSVLRACFVQNSGRVVGGSSLPPSSSRVVDMITEFFRCGDVAHRFRTACVAVMNLLRVEINTPDNSDVWSGIDVMQSTSQSVAALRIVSPESVSTLRSSAHSSHSVDLSLVVPNRACRALRAPRFLCALRKAVANGALVPGKLRASILLSSVARFRSDKRFRAAAIERETLCPLADRAQQQFPFNNDEYSSIQQDSITPFQMVQDPALQFVADDSGEHNRHPCVPLQLERDYVIMKCLQRMIPDGGGIVTLKEIGKKLMSEGGYFHDHSERSVEQSVSWVVKKCEEKAKAKMLTDGKLEYVKAATGVKGGGSLSLDAMGARGLYAFLRTTLLSMETADSTFMNEWHVSRSSRNKAKSAAALKAVGGSQAGKKRPSKA